MSASYTCPNPDCGVTLKTPNRVPAGKKVKCPKCNRQFVPEPEDGKPAAGPGTFKLADEPAKPAAKPPAPAKNPRTHDDEDDPESIKKGYGVVKETEAEIEQAEKNKPKFGEVQDKFKKSARGPAIGLLVTGANLLTAEGLITALAGLVVFVVGMWPLVFNDAPPGDEETEEAIITMILGLVGFGWGVLICVGASQMQDLSSYPWAMIGAVMGILPLLVGIYVIIMLQNPRVKAGFEEISGALDEDEDEDDEGDGEGGGGDDDDDDGGGEEEEEEARGRKKSKAQR
jgi:uncharacterized membrane protein